MAHAITCIVVKLVVERRFILLVYRAGGNGMAGTAGTAGTAMAVPVFEGEKMASLGF